MIDICMNKANRHKSRALRTISHKIYKKNSKMYGSLRNVWKSQKCMEVSEMYGSLRNVCVKKPRSSQVIAIAIVIVIAVVIALGQELDEGRADQQIGMYF